MSESDSSSQTAPRWQRRPEARPEEILDAALAVFGESGFARAKIEDVARLAGVMSIVLAGGVVRPGDPIAVELPEQPHVPLQPV